MNVPLPELDGVEHRFVDAAGLRMHVALAGPEDGPPIVLLHGWPEHWWLWRELIGPLATDGHRVICPDLRGCGWTEAPRRGYHKQQLADDVLAALDALGVQRFALAGHDWGGWVGFLICLGQPERVSRYLALNIPAPFRQPVRTALRYLPHTYYQVINATPVLGWALSRTGLTSRVTLRVGRVSDPAPFVATYRTRNGARATVQIYRSFLLRDSREQLRRPIAPEDLKVPSRILFGADDPAIPPYMLDVARPVVDVELVEGIGHFIVDEAPDLVLDRIRSWLSTAAA